MATDDGQLHIVFNGEIYNYNKLRDGLLAEGVHFRGHSDTEVLLQLYRRYGESMVHHLRGMFAFAIWDLKRHSLFLARDPYGIKPLYYSDAAGVFRFASQVKALQAGGGVSRELDPAGLTGFFLWGSVPEPFTVYEGIQTLPAGATLKVTRSGPQTPESYWDLPAVVAKSIRAAADIPRGEEREYLRSALRASVEAHMVADVPVGAFLSAGFDSATVAGLAREISSNTLQTITLAFDEFKGKAIDELPLAIRIADHLAIQHKGVTTTMAEVEAEFPRFLDAMDQPTIDGINTWFVSKAASEAGFKVALSGLGGDELLGGYPSFRAIPRMVRKWRPLGRIPLLGDVYRIAYSRLVAPFSSTDSRQAGLLKFGGCYQGAYQLYRGVFMPWELPNVLDADFARAGLQKLQLQRQRTPADHSNLTAFGNVAVLESSQYMRNQLLRDTDWTGMAHSIEIRVPLVDSVLTETVVGLAATGRLGEGKAMLPRALRKPLPTEVLNRPKTGFTVPVWKWLRNSETFGSWRENRLLRRANIRDCNRWAYSLISALPAARDLLK